MTVKQPVAGLGLTAAERDAILAAGKGPRVDVPNDAGPNRIYSARELMRRVEEPGPFHNFPESINKDIFAGQRTVVSDRYVLYTKDGTITLPGEPIYGKAQVRIGDGQRVREIIGTTPSRIVEGTFEIGVRPSVSGRTEVITHRFFRPKESQ
ncbi:hypothetical protein HNQ59_004007 [Chitinivorax tropicus]|uniref:Uncharacterized protein n=1 Tax=Chitinivorax tropicus TaxID=714531 RepID=A0A840MV53_9PROT|nr:hypothetical protein [Chitinivorax tropicus]